MCRFTPIVNENIKDIVIYEHDFDFIFNENKHYNIGDRVAQIVFLELPKITLIEADELSDTERGEYGFGSTEKNNNYIKH